MNKHHGSAAEAATAAQTEAAAAAEPPPFSETLETPDTSFDAIINLFRFTRDHFMDLPQKGIVDTCVEILGERINNSFKPSFCVSAAGEVAIYYRGKWIAEPLDDIVKRRGEAAAAAADEDDAAIETAPVLCEAIDMFIENMMLQFRRNRELHEYFSISREIENGYRTNQQIKIIKGLTAAVAAPPKT